MKLPTTLKTARYASIAALVALWLASLFGEISLVLHPSANTEIVAGVVRGRAAFHWRKNIALVAWNSSGWHWQYRGAPQALAHVFGALHYELNGGLVRSERYYAALEIPLPIIAFVLILGAQLWRSGFRFRLSRLLTVVTLLCLLLVYYLYLQPPAALP